MRFKRLRRGLMGSVSYAVLHRHFGPASQQMLMQVLNQAMFATWTHHGA